MLVTASTPIRRRSSASSQIVFVGAGAGTDTTPNFPSNAGSQNRLYIIQHSDAATSTLPDLIGGAWVDWEEWVYSGQIAMRLEYTISSSSTVPTPTVDGSRCAWLVYSGFNASTPLGTAAFEQSVAGATLEHPAITFSAPTLSWAIGGFYQRGSVTAPVRTGWTERANAFPSSLGNTTVGDSAAPPGGNYSLSTTVATGGAGTPQLAWHAELFTA